MAQNKKVKEWTIPGSHYDSRGLTVIDQNVLYMECGTTYRSEAMDFRREDTEALIEVVERQIQMAFANGKSQALKDLGQMLGVKE